MKKFIPALTFLFAVFFIIIFLVTRHHGDEWQIRRNLSSLAAMVSGLGNESELVAMNNIRKMKSLFTKDCHIAVGSPVPEMTGHDMLVSTVYQVRKMVNNVDVDFYDISVTIGENRVTARTTMTATVTRREGERGTEAREVEMRWKKVEGVWKIAEVQLVKTLR